MQPHGLAISLGQSLGATGFKNLTWETYELATCNREYYIRQSTDLRDWIA